MDAIDDRILAILTEDGRISFSALGTRIGLSTNAAAARVRRLETAGVIVGYRAVLAKDVPGTVDGIEAFIDVRLRPEQDSDAFMQWALGHPAVRDAVHVTGPYDYLVHVVVPGTADLDELLRGVKSSAGAAQTQTRLALRPHR